MTARTRRLLPFLAVAAAVVAAVAWLLAGSPLGARGEGGRWVRVERGDLSEEVEITGTLEATRTSRLSPPQISRVWEFKVTSLVPEGEEVEAGQTVVTFDASELERRLATRRNEADQAQAELEKHLASTAKQRDQLALELAEAEGQVRRQRLATSIPGDLEAEKERQRKSLSFQLAQERVEHLQGKQDLLARSFQAQTALLTDRRDRARERVAELQESIDRLRLTAPRRGTVIYSTSRGSEKVKVGDSVWQGRSLVEIPNLDEMQAAGEIDEADAGRVRTGQPVRLILDAHAGLEYRGTVEEIGRAVTERREQLTREKVVSADVALEETDPRRMRPGMRFRGWVETERLEDVLLVPVEAVRSSARGNQVVRRKGAASGLLGGDEVEIELGRESGGRVQVLSGLEEGDRVWVPDEEASR